MSRPLRIQYPDAWYHVMNRGRRGESVFHGKEDYLCFIDLLKETAEMWSLRVNCFGADTDQSGNVTIYLLRTLRGDTLNEIGREVNMNRYSSVSSVVQSMSAKISNPRASPAISPNSNVRRHVKARR